MLCWRCLAILHKNDEPYLEDRGPSGWNESLMTWFCSWANTGNYLILDFLYVGGRNEINFLSLLLGTRSISSLCGWERWTDTVLMLQEGGPLPGPESGLLSNTRKRIVRGDTRADKARDFIGKGRLDWEQEGKGTQENCSAMWLTVLGFTVMGLVSGLSLANHADSGSLPVAHTSLRQDEFQRGGFWEVGRTYGLASPFISFWPFPNSSGWWWLVSSVFLTRISCCKITHADGYCAAWPGWAVSVSVSPNTYSPETHLSQIPSWDWTSNAGTEWGPPCFVSGG